jgi:hypothetical protein
MRKYLFFLLLLVLPAWTSLQAQKNDTLRKPWNHFSLSISPGWTHYVNSLQNVGESKVRLDFAGVALKFFWEPEHRLSLGLETGYYTIFKLSQEVSPGETGTSTMTCIPFLLVARMRIFDHFYLSAAPGLALIYTRLEGVGDKITSHQTSLSNFEVAASYLYPVSRLFSVGGTAAFMSIGKTNDYLYSIQAVCTVKL